MFLLSCRGCFLSGVMLGAKQLFCKYVTPQRFSTSGFGGRWPKNINGLGRVNGTEPSAPLNPGRSIAEAKSENVWMEVCIKVAAAALVSVPWRVAMGKGVG